MTLSIIVPCYNEEAVLPETTQRLTSMLNHLQAEGKITDGCIVYVNDGSTDHTWSLIAQYAQQDERVKGLSLAHNAGHQQAL